MRQVIYATAVLIGMIIGVGIFGVPYVTAKAGFAIGLGWLLLLGGLCLLINLFYSQVALATPGKHRLAGYSRYHLGKFWKMIAAIVNMLGFWGAQIAYLIVGGKFLYLLLGRVFGGDELVYQLIFFVVMALCILGGLRTVESVELGMSGLLLVTVFSILGWGLPKIEWQNLIDIDWAKSFLPYGVILFALGGAAAIPEMLDIVKKDSQKLKKAILAGTTVAILLTILFVFTVVGINGHNATPEALQGLSQASSNGLIIVLGVFFGILAIATSFLVLGLNLKEVFQYDYKLNGFLAWFLAVVVPFLVFLAGAKDFINVIDFTGAIFGGLDGILIVILFLKVFAKKETSYKSSIWHGLAIVSILVFLIGMMVKIF